MTVAMCANMVRMWSAASRSPSAPGTLCLNLRFSICREDMSLFKKPKKHGRNRGPVVEEEEDQEDDSIMEIQANINKLKQKDKDKKKKKEKKKVEEKKAAPLLSFEDEQEDDEEESFKVKKSSASRRLMKAKTKAEKEARFFAEPPPPPPYSPPPSLSENGSNGKKYMDGYKSEDNDVAIVIKVSSAFFYSAENYLGLDVKLVC